VREIFGAKEDRGMTELFHGMVAESAVMRRRVFNLIDQLANAREPVMITGESGAGKELVARALHERSERKAKPYLALNCGALSPLLIESELFGHVRGSFTGAMHDKTGAFQATDDGTLFLDEIGELPLDLQPKLLRVLESSCIRRVGGVNEIPVRTRVLASTHRNLRALVAHGRFRADLFHRLVVHVVEIPPLRDRRGDVLPLVRHFLETYVPGRKMKIEQAAEAVLKAHAWPGNVRELRNVLVRAIALARGDVIARCDLRFAEDLFATEPRERSARNARRRRRRRADEEEQILCALEHSGGNRAEAARLLGISRSTFYARMRRYGVPRSA
jgi:DNA-binding NtrC family response regulator